MQNHRSSARAGASRALATAASLTALATLPACRQDMNDQPRHEPLEASSFFRDGASSRKPIAGTVPRQGSDQVPGSGLANSSGGTSEKGGFITASPIPVNRDLLLRGRERFGIYCSPCHGMIGDGRGMIVQRGFKQPQSFHTPRLRAQPIGYFVDVITNGFGVMPSYAPQVPPRDRWAIAAYIGALQLSQYARAADLSSDDLAQIEAAPSASPGTNPAQGAP
ncbi:MAG TPA: cytochrome c [Polyangiaceae bacterium]|nr:cytochrome c [Polyangiaceae bacterium]